MKFSWAWLQEHLDLTAVTPEQAAAGLGSIGVVVSSIETVGSELADLRVGHVETCGRHPDADKLSVTSVSFGTEKSVPVVCGAPNVRQGLRIAFAPVGSVIPGGIQLKPAKLRGQASQGMICSERELGLSEDHAGIMELPEDAPVGARLLDYLGLADIVLDVDDRVLSRRPDLRSHRGLARELAACLELDIKSMPEASFPDSAPKAVAAPTDRAPGYAAASIECAESREPTPWSIRRRLLAIGELISHPISSLARFVSLDTGVAVDVLASQGQDPLSTDWDAPIQAPAGCQPVGEDWPSHLLLQATPDGSRDQAVVAGQALARVLQELTAIEAGRIVGLMQVDAAANDGEATVDEGFPFDPQRLAPIALAEALPVWKRYGFRESDSMSDGRIRIAPPPWRAEFTQDSASTRFEFEALRMLGFDRIESRAFAMTVPAIPSAVARLESRLRAALVHHFRGEECLCPPNRSAVELLAPPEAETALRTGTRFAFGGGIEFAGFSELAPPPAPVSSGGRWLSVLHWDRARDQPDGPRSLFGWARSLVEALTELTAAGLVASCEAIESESVPEAWHPGRCQAWRLQGELVAWTGEQDPRRDPSVAPQTERIALACLDLDAWAKAVSHRPGEASASKKVNSPLELQLQVPAKLRFDVFRKAWSESAVAKKVASWELVDARRAPDGSTSRWQIQLQWKKADKPPSVKEVDSWLRKLDAWLEELNVARA